MGRFGANDIDNYGSTGSSFFSLKNDGDVARVRIMYKGMEDVGGYAVHQVKIDDKQRYVNCLRAYNEPKTNCPLCASNNFQRVKLYIPVYDIDEDEVKLWERGKVFFQKISSLCSRYASADRPLVAHTFDIERHGKKGDTSTTYEIYETGCDNTTLEDLPEVPEVLGSIILDKSFDDVEYFVDNGYFPNNDGAVDRGSRRGNDSDREQYNRRTPANRDRF